MSGQQPWRARALEIIGDGDGITPAALKARLNEEGHDRTGMNVIGFLVTLRDAGIIEQPSPGRWRAATGREREHEVQLSRAQAITLACWLTSPNGSLPLGRVTFEAVEGGGILVRTRAWEPQ